MENRITTGTIVALACSAMLAYAAPQHRPHTGAPPGASGPASRDQKQRQITTVTGCLQQGPSPRSFILIQTPGTSIPNGGVGSAGGRDEHAIRYDLVTKRTSDVAKLVGYQVEASGTPSITPPIDSRPTGDREHASAASALTRFNAASVRPTGRSC